MSEFAETWGLYPWFAEHGLEPVHPSDWERFPALSPYGKLFHCLAEEAGYLVLQYGSQTYRVNPDLYQAVPAPLFNFGDHVQKNGQSDRRGIIRQIHWHHQKASPIYLVQMEGQSKLKRYLQEELEATQGDHGAIGVMEQ